ncbi:DUF5689 domain-containing protein [Balneola sp. MJW-20]|uniref:DUF5689 domain-containing protein n=1 Tax=Gracilimonas aurantiaca TaxID=3234185 RepID=UPI00390902A1
MPSLTHAQLAENFESGTKSSYSGASVELNTGTWYFDGALLGDLGNDKKNGSKAARLDLRSGNRGQIYMLFDKPDGVSKVTFEYANYGSDAGGRIQVRYSTDSGANWINVGDEFIATSQLQTGELDINVNSKVRLRFEMKAGDRVNIDDVILYDYIVPEADPTIDVFADNELQADGGTLTMPSTQAGSVTDRTIRIRNRGEDTLFVNNVSVAGSVFSISTLENDALAFNESTELTLTFSPEAVDQYQGSLTINSNAVNAPEYNINLSAEGVAEGAIIPIADARQQDFGTRVTVAGRVTVGNEFEGPLFMQDETAGIAVFFPALHETAFIGDSVIVSGPLTEFNPISGPEGDFLTQIAATDSDPDVSYTIVQANPKEVTPKVITLQQMNSGDYEGQLVLIQNVEFLDAGSFQGNTNYDIADASGNGFIRIDNSTNIVGAAAPTEPVNVIGVVDQFNGDYQLKPRFVDDLGVSEITYPGDEISKDQTLEVVTWNIEWFGSAANDPADDNLQLQNVKTVINTIDADIYAFQEISNSSLFQQLISELDGYGGFQANFSQTQKTAYLFKRATIDSLDSGLITTGMQQSDWANGRYPLMFRFITNISGIQEEIYSFNIHAKAFDDLDSYDQRLNASAQLKTYLDNQHPDDQVFFIGDYNDEVTTSITAGQDSPYKNFLDDQEYTILTESLESSGFESQSSGSFIDHISVTSELMGDYFEGTERVENPSYIGSYLSTTSDHFPVWVRFDLGLILSNEDGEEGIPEKIDLEQNYPNPFNPTTLIRYNLDQAAEVNLEVFDVMGRKVATLVDQPQNAGRQQVQFDASGLASGVYIYRLSTSGGAILTRKMTLIK